MCRIREHSPRLNPLVSHMKRIYHSTNSTHRHPRSIGIFKLLQHSPIYIYTIECQTKSNDSVLTMAAAVGATTPTIEEHFSVNLRR